MPRVLGHDNDDDHGYDDDYDDHGDDHDDNIRPSCTVPAGSFEARIDDDDADRFEHGTITIDAGQSVIWVNVDDDPPTASSGEFDTGIMQPGDPVTITFEAPGSSRMHARFTRS